MLLNRKEMNIFDIITIIILLFAIFDGWRKGFISQLLSLAGIVGGVALAIAFGDKVGALFGIDAAYSKIVGFIITFFVAAIVATLLSRLIASLFSALGLGGINILLGIALSAVKYLLILSVVFVAVERLNNNLEWVDKGHFKNSKSFKPVTTLSGKALDWFNAFTNEE